MSQSAAYDVDASGIIYFGTEYLVRAAARDKSLKIMQKANGKRKKKKKEKKKKADKQKKIIYDDPHSTSYYFNRLIDIIGSEFFSYCSGYSLNYLFSTDLRNWGKVIPSYPTNSYRWKLFEKDAVDRIQKLLHHYRKLYSYFDRKPDPRTNSRSFREGFKSPLLLFAVYDLNDFTNKNTLYRINSINIKNLLQKHLFERKPFIQYVNGGHCLHLKIVLYLYLNAVNAVRLFRHNNFDWGSHKLLPTPTPTFQQLHNEQLIAKRLELIEQGESIQNLPPIKPFQLTAKDKILQHQEVQMKMWMHNFCNVVNLDNVLHELAIHEPHKYYAGELRRIHAFKEKNKYYFENPTILKKYQYVNPKNAGFQYLRKRHLYNQQIAEYMKTTYGMKQADIFEDNLEVEMEGKRNRRLSKLTLKRMKSALDAERKKAKDTPLQTALKLANGYYMKDTTELQISYETFIKHLDKLRAGTSRVEMELIVHRSFDRLGFAGNGSRDIVKYWISLPKLVAKCKFKLVIVPKWFNIFKYAPEWRRFNKQLRELFCPNLLRIRLLYLFIANNKGTLFGWTYNNRILVFQALLTDVSRT